MLQTEEKAAAGLYAGNGAGFYTGNGAGADANNYLDAHLEAHRSAAC